MSVGLSAPTAGALRPIPDIRIGIARAGIRKADHDDLVVMLLPSGATMAGVFTQNRYCAAPVVLCRERRSSDIAPRALVINTGYANAGTGTDGMVRAEAVCHALARQLGCDERGVWPFSTGVIMETLPSEKIIAALPAAVAEATEDNWLRAAAAIMTTDTVPKGRSLTRVIADTPVTITGIAKGSGMIHPNMATMLGYIAIDARLPTAVLQAMLAEVNEESFSRVTIDGDSSTNDAFMLIASGRPQSLEVTSSEHPAYAPLRDAVAEVAIFLAQALARDGEGATKFVTIEVSGGRDRAECRQVGKAIAHSPLVKTALFASDPNLGRILAAVGNAGVDDLEVGNIGLWLGDVRVVVDGGRDPAYVEAEADAVMAAPEITIHVDLGRGTAIDQVWTCDFSYDYVRINAEYRS